MTDWFGDENAVEQDAGRQRSLLIHRSNKQQSTTQLLMR